MGPCDRFEQIRMREGVAFVMAEILKKTKRPLNEVFGDFYSPEKLLSYNRPFNMTVGSRSIGKSTGWGIQLLADYVNHGRRWCYVRRDRDELSLTASTWFDNAADILRFNNWDVPPIYLEKQVYYNDKKEPCGYAIPLALQHKYKSIGYNNVWWEIYDEFLTPSGRYIGGAGSNREHECLMSLYQTLDRGIGRPFRNEVKIICIGNAYNYYNPLFVNFGVDRYLRTDTKMLAPRGKLWAVEQTRETEATKKIKTSYAYLLSSESTKSQMYDNMLAGTSGTFIKKITSPMRGMFNIIYEGVKYGVYLVPNMGKIYVSRRPTTCNIEVCATTDDHRPNYLMIQRFSMFGGTIELKKAFERGDVLFDSGKSQYMLFNFMLYA